MESMRFVLLLVGGLAGSAGVLGSHFTYKNLQQTNDLELETKKLETTFKQEMSNFEKG